MKCLESTKVSNLFCPRVIMSGYKNEKLIKRKYGLLGQSLGHSFSQDYFNNKFEREQQLSDCEYYNFELDSLDEINGLLNMNGLIGFNVTLPYKEKIIGHLDELSPLALELGAVNTVKKENEKWVGYNTDVIGFDLSLRDRHFNRALILGTGGASKAIVYVLDSRKIPHQFISRSKSIGEMTYEELSHQDLSAYDLIINTTPLGMFPKIKVKPNISYTQLTSNHFLYDLVYNPIKSLFLELGERNGARIKNGQAMLEFQAEAAWRIWNKT